MNPEIKLPPKIDKVPLNLKVRPELKEALRTAAKEEERSETEILEALLEWGLVKGKAKK